MPTLKNQPLPTRPKGHASLPPAIESLEWIPPQRLPSSRSVHIYRCDRQNSESGQFLLLNAPPPDETAPQINASHGRRSQHKAYCLYKPESQNHAVAANKSHRDSSTSSKHLPHWSADPSDH